MDIDPNKLSDSQREYLKSLDNLSDEEVQRNRNIHHLTHLAVKATAGFAAIASGVEAYGGRPKEAAVLIGFGVAALVVTHGEVEDRALSDYELERREQSRSKHRQKNPHQKRRRKK